MRSLIAILVGLAACTRAADRVETPVTSSAPVILEDDRMTVTDAPRPRSAANAFTFALRDDDDGNTAGSGLTLRRAWLLAALAGRRELLPVLGVATVDAIAAERARLDAPGLVLAAHAWFAPGTVPASDVRADLRHALDAGSDSFVRGAGGAAPINDWVARQTGIRDLVRDPDAHTQRVLVSTLRYRAPWTKPFAPTSTRPAPFALSGRGATTATTARAEVPMMTEEAELPFARSEHASFVALPLGEGDAFLMLAVPTSGTLAQLEEDLQGGLHERAVAGLSLAEGIVELPRFRITGDRSTTALPAGYEALASLADEVVIHERVEIDVDEAGASAVAAAAVVPATIATPPHGPPPPRRLRIFRGDRPFLYWLVHARTSEILVSGRVVDPR